LIAKSVTIKRRDGRSGGCVGKAVKLTSGDLHCCPEVGTEEAARHPERGAEVSRGRSREEAGSAIEALRKPKGGETARSSRNVSNRRPERCPQGLERQDE